jgi:hypothetical protein
MVTLTERGLSPLTQYDAEEINALAVGTEFDLVKRSNRSRKHLRTYWKALAGVVKATGRWATAEYLHYDLMYACGFVRWGIDLKSGDLRKTRDSIAIDAMTQAEFKVYFDAAMAELADAVGYDPLRFMDEPR